MSTPRFNFLFPPIHVLQEHLKAALTKNPFIAGSQIEKSGEGGRRPGDQEPTDSPPDAPAPPDESEQ